ncbi:sterol uptake control protein 2 [Podospora aff. communis PSN243]|uniref:Sterol uptake control protein 2 n=1 Tax=Podospora aff. communis PSN243 TaxID=3040156 RepID=A0AAV9H4K7_9PEZI|nr:sterol uptake control protein 2 [Podospora aff. communis PSN243]
MMRRRHRKSRKGCLECKRRHIKCDETRPRCINCSTAERDCPYPTTEDGPGISPGEGASPAALDPGSGSGPSSVSPSAPVLSDHDPNFPSLPFSDGPPFSHLPQEVAPLVNMGHAELLHHFLTDSDMVYSLAVSMARDIVIAQALREPYLMHQCLALSASHLSVIRPHLASYYHNQAIQLQTQALTLFNAIDISQFEISVAHRVPGFVFSAILGFHALCDMLSYRDADFPSALARYVSYLRLHRGVYQIMEGHWEEIRETDLKPIIEAGIGWFEMESEGHECDDIRQRISQAGLDEETLKATMKAIGFVQCVFDGRPVPVGRTHILVSFGVMIPKAFFDLLESGRPEAMVVLAYYFLALHTCRSVWMIGGAGEHLFELVVNYLGEQWESWLERPKELMRMLKEEDGGDEMFTIARPTPAEAARIAEIHIAAMDANPLLHAQFPTAQSLAAAKEFLMRYTASQLGSATSGVLVAKETGTGRIVGFAKWDSPSHREEVKLESGELQDVDGCQREYLDGYVKLAEEAMERSFGDRECYRLSFVCIHPEYQGRGAGSELTRTVLEMAAVDRMPVYLESTESSVPMYEKYGFKQVDSFEMDMPGGSKYREVCMVLEHPVPPHP